MPSEIKNQLARDLGIDAAVGRRLIDVKIGVTGLRSVRMGLMQLAYALAERTDFEGFLLLVDMGVTRERLRQEWDKAASVLRPEVVQRLTMCMDEAGAITGFPHSPDSATKEVLRDVLERERQQLGPRLTRPDASFVVLKILLHHWLTNGNPVTTDWLVQTAGFSYPTVAKALHSLGGLIERGSDRRVRLRWFPQEEYSRLLALSNRARETVRFADRSGEPRPPEAHLRRLERLNPPGLAVGGVLGAKHYFPELDLVGTPRLDLSLHSPKRRVDLGFVAELDPALTRVEDPIAPAAVVVHVVHHTDPLFAPRESGLNWADPVECLLDLHEARLEPQATQFLQALKQRRRSFS